MSGAHHLAAAAFLFALGASVGSFLNVCAHRIPLGLGLSHPPSRCPGCGSGIAPRDNLPVLGWLMLKGRCRSCGMAISPRYPVIEAAVGLLLVVAYLAAAPADLLERGPALLAWRVLDALALSAFLVTGALIAGDRGAVPRSIASVGLLAALLLGATRPDLPGEATTSGLRDALLGLASCGGTVLLARHLGGRASAPGPIAPGDPAFAAMVGAFVGIRAALPVFAIASAILLASEAFPAILRRTADPNRPPLPLPLALGLAGLATIPAGPWLGLG
ncbi:prepilin peptidase [Tautonia plasticadhaerens]|uniref:Leader peptidase PppA n=1 Tax=Tautonia plasticadhaerens TaxID=2527974 RepID=A0A518HFR3_9BACT|nr:prepilin peptidase [Tautonia plasticadhaerens]QDV39668.1 Leader peptidase PppA [Tautonia plasticadhaerens]